VAGDPPSFSLIRDSGPQARISSIETIEIVIFFMLLSSYSLRSYFYQCFFTTAAWIPDPDRKRNRRHVLPETRDMPPGLHLMSGGESYPANDRLTLIFL
jgi:hypothetical protein